MLSYAQEVLLKERRQIWCTTGKECESKLNFMCNDIFQEKLHALVAHLSAQH